MTFPGQLTRRRFLAAAGVAALSVKAQALPLSRPPRFAFVAENSACGAIRVYAIEDRRRELLQQVPAESPAALALHPNGKVLYALHEVEEYLNLPRGYISAYQIDPNSGSLSLLSLQPLSLSATLPRHFAVSPNGNCVAVSAYGGALLNLLHLNNDGSLGRVFAIRKETGRGQTGTHPNRSHPEGVIFDSSGHSIFVADSGIDTVSVFSAGPSLQLFARCPLPAGSGPRSLTLAPNSRLLHVSCAKSGRLACLRYDNQSLRLDLVSLREHRVGNRPLTEYLAADTKEALHRVSSKATIEVLS